MGVDRKRACERHVFVRHSKLAVGDGRVGRRPACEGVALKCGLLRHGHLCAVGHTCLPVGSRVAVGDVACHCVGDIVRVNGERACERHVFVRHIELAAADGHIGGRPACESISLIGGLRLHGHLRAVGHIGLVERRNVKACGNVACHGIGDIMLVDGKRTCERYVVVRHSKLAVGDSRVGRRPACEGVTGVAGLLCHGHLCAVGHTRLLSGSRIACGNIAVHGIGDIMRVDGKRTCEIHVFVRHRKLTAADGHVFRGPACEGVAGIAGLCRHGHGSAVGDIRLIERRNVKARGDVARHGIGDIVLVDGKRTLHRHVVVGHFEGCGIAIAILGNVGIGNVAGLDIPAGEGVARLGQLVGHGVIVGVCHFRLCGERDGRLIAACQCICDLMLVAFPHGLIGDVILDGDLGTFGNGCFPFLGFKFRGIVLTCGGDQLPTLEVEPCGRCKGTGGAHCMLPVGDGFVNHILTGHIGVIRPAGLIGNGVLPYRVNGVFRCFKIGNLDSGYGRCRV